VTRGALQAWEAMSRSVQPFGSARKVSVSSENGGSQQSGGSQEIGRFRKNFVPLLSPNLSAIQARAADMLTVRDVAVRLKVSRATVYALCDRRELAHFRISNAIRIAPAELAASLPCSSNEKLRNTDIVEEIWC